MVRYSFNITWSENDQEFMATCPSFPGLSAFGDTEEEALQEAKVALELFIESYKERGVPLPAASGAEGYSGQFRLRLSPALHRQAADLAALEKQSLNTFIALAVQARVSSIQVGVEIADRLAEKMSLTFRKDRFEPIVKFDESISVPAFLPSELFRSTAVFEPSTLKDSNFVRRQGYSVHKIGTAQIEDETARIPS